MNYKGYKYAMSITVQKVTLAVKIACKMKITLKRGNYKQEFQTQAELKDGQLIFNDTITSHINVIQNDQGKYQPKAYQLDFGIITQSGNKNAGYCQFDLAPYMNDNKMKINQQIKLEKCPDKNATCFFTISLQLLQEIDAEVMQQLNQQQLTGNESFDNSRYDTKSDSKNDLSHTSKNDISHTSDCKVSSPTILISPKQVKLDTPFISEPKTQILGQVSKFDQNMEQYQKELAAENIKLKQQIQELILQSQKQEQKHQQEILSLTETHNKYISKINTEYAQQVGQYKQLLKQKEEQHLKDESKQLELSQESISLKEVVQKQKDQLQEIEKQVNEQIRIKINSVKQQYDVSLNGYKQTIEQKDLIIKQLQEQKNGTFVEYKNEKTKSPLEETQLNKIISEQNIRINDLLNQQQKNKEEIILYTNKLAQMQKLITKYEFSINETEATRKIEELEAVIDGLKRQSLQNSGQKSPRSALKDHQLKIEIPKQNQQSSVVQDQVIESQQQQVQLTEAQRTIKQQDEQLKAIQSELTKAQETINNLKNRNGSPSEQSDSIQELKIKFEAEKMILSKEYQKIIQENSEQQMEAQQKLKTDIHNLQREVVLLKGRIGDMFNAAYNMSGPRLVEKMQIALGLKEQ